MRNALKYRLCLIILTILIGLGAFFAFAEPVLCSNVNDRHSIVAHVIGRHSTLVDFDLGLAVANALFILSPVTFTFLIVDLYGLRKAPVQHIGCFAFCSIAIAMNVIVSLGLWIAFGGWAPPAIAPVIIAILVATLIPATISEWRIFQSSPESDETAG